MIHKSVGLSRRGLVASGAAASAGVAIVSAGMPTVTVSGVALTRDSLIFATTQDTHGGGVRAAVPNPESNSFTIYMHRRARAPSRVAWFVLD
jgi:hypothetical protein